LLDVLLALLVFVTTFLVLAVVAALGVAIAFSGAPGDSAAESARTDATLTACLWIALVISFVGYFAVSYRFWGRTVGMWAAGLSLVHIPSGATRLRWGAALARSLALCLSYALCGLLWIVYLVVTAASDTRRGPHDRVAKTGVLTSRVGVPRSPIVRSAIPASGLVSIDLQLRGGSNFRATSLEYSLDEQHWVPLKSSSASTSITISGLSDPLPTVLWLRGLNGFGPGPATRIVPVAAAPSAPGPSSRHGANESSQVAADPAPSNEVRAVETEPAVVGSPSRSFDDGHTSDAQPSQPRVFISHASLDDRLALTLAQALEAQGMRTWIASRDVAVGANYAAEIFQGLTQSDYLLVLLSQSSIESAHVRREVSIAIDRKVPVLPVSTDSTGELMANLPEDWQYWLNIAQVVRMTDEASTAAEIAKRVI